MLTCLRELHQVLGWIERDKQELDAVGAEYDQALAVGAMIEVPAAAVMAEVFAALLDFLSIGTNDLIQYSLAADRLDEEVNYLYVVLLLVVLCFVVFSLWVGVLFVVLVVLC